MHTVRDVGAVSGAIAGLAAGAMLGLRGPFGTAWPIEAAEGSDVVFVAGGLGLAPLRPAIYQVLAQRARYGRVVLLYGTRNPPDILFRARAGAMAAAARCRYHGHRRSRRCRRGAAMSAWCRG